MSEKMYHICQSSTHDLFSEGWITESELYRRIYLAFRTAFCTLDETIDYDKAVEIIVHGEGENQNTTCRGVKKKLDQTGTARGRRGKNQ